MSRVGRNIVVTGRVQGVGYRYFARKTAEAFDIDGSVRNNADGSVEIRASGEPENMKGFVEQLELGPSGAFVDRVEQTDITSDITSDISTDPIPAGFHILRD